MAAKKKAMALAGESPDALLQDVRTLIREARGRVAMAVNVGLVLLYWHIGTRIRHDILGQERAEYGKEIFSTLSRKLVAEFGKGFSTPNLFRMARFAEAFPDFEMIQTLSAQLSWSHFVEIVPLKDDLQRDFYAEKCRVERWSVRALQAKIQGMLYERTALSLKPEEPPRGPEPGPGPPRVVTDRRRRRCEAAPPVTAERMLPWKIGRAAAERPSHG